MPNLRPPVTTVVQAQAYESRILEAAKIAGYPKFHPLMTLYLTDNTQASEIQKAKDSGIVGVKLYPAGATTNSDAGVTDINRCDLAIAKMAELNMPLLVHGEVTHSLIDIFDREAKFIEEVLEPLRKRHPRLRVVFEHITTKQAAEYVENANTTDFGEIAATITAHHLLYNRNALFTGGVRPHYYCLPILKREEHRQALLSAATGHSKRFFLGTDSAPHAQDLKENACGCAGCFTAAQAIELYAQAFDSVGKLQQLESFASFNGPDFYGLPRNQDVITIEKVSQKIPSSYPMGKDMLVPLNAGESLEWTFLG
jgi:dihydroorotase